MTRGPKEPPEDSSEFLDAMDGVKPLQDRRVHARGSRKLTVGQLQRQHDAVHDSKSVTDPNYLHQGEVAPVDPIAVLEWKKDGVQPEVFSRLRLGKYPVDGKLDLHGRTVMEARADLYKFIGLCLSKGWRAVVIAHGRGVKSATPGRLKSYTAHWLIEIPDVLAYHSAPQHLGGTGAVVCWIRKSRKASADNSERHGGRALEP